jgi:hypothetical protein
MNDIERTAGAETTAVEEAKGISLLRGAAQRREKRVHAAFLDVPSWDGDLIAEYRVVNRPKLEQMARKISAESKGGNEANLRTGADIDFIVEACVGLYALDPEGATEEERRVPLTDELGKIDYTRFGDVLLRIAGEGRTVTHVPRTAREVVLKAFAKDNEDPTVPISAHAMVIARWMRDPSKAPTTMELG